jgi:hypothetical protein
MAKSAADNRVRPGNNRTQRSWITYRVKVYGEGEWQVSQHGVEKRRAWRKPHFCVDESTREIISVVASAKDVNGA